MFNKLFWSQSVEIEYLHLGSSQSCLLVTDWSNTLVIIRVASISAYIMSWGTNALLLIMHAIIETKGLSKPFQLFSLQRLGSQVSTA
mgnify:CR=1 FL=1